MYASCHKAFKLKYAMYRNNDVITERVGNGSDVDLVFFVMYTYFSIWKVFDTANYIVENVPDKVFHFLSDTIQVYVSGILVH